MKHIIFDLDGTLIDSMPVWQNTGAHFLENHGFTPPEDLHKIVKTQTLYQTAEYFRDTLGVPCTVEEIIDEVISFVEEQYRTAIPLKPYVREFLEKQKAEGTKMCILTASEDSYIGYALDRLDIRKYFDFIMTCTETGHYKTEPDVFEIAMKKLGGTKEDTFVFEDALYAVEGAKKGNFKVYAIADPITETDSTAIRAAADRYINSYSELL